MATKFLAETGPLEIKEMQEVREVPARIPGADKWFPQVASPSSLAQILSSLTLLIQGHLSH